MANRTNRQWRLKARPRGLPGREVWDYVEEDPRAPGDGEVLVKVEYISLDPAMRGWMNEGKSYIPPVGLGEVMRAGAVGEVVESLAEGFAAGDKVVGTLGVQTYATVNAGDLRKVDTSIAPLERYLSGLGMTGMTAYFGLLDVGAPKAGETVLVSGAAGAVGSVVGQIAKIKGCRAVGIAGGPEKVKALTARYGYDAAIDYKSEELYDAIRDTCPEGVDVYFDNVGGETLDTVLRCINRGARIVICGAISQYNDMASVSGPSNYLSLLVNRARMEGFIVFDYAERYDEAAREIASWMNDGKLVVEEDIQSGFARFPEIFQMLFKGENRGKLLLAPAVDQED